MELRLLTARPGIHSELRSALALDPHMRVLVAHGCTDLVTPYFESRLILGPLPDLGDTSRSALRDAARGVIGVRRQIL